MSLTASTTIEPTPEIIWREVADEVVLLDPDGNMIMGLNGTGGKAWLLLDGKRSLAEVAILVAQDFDQDRERVEPDIIAFAEVLLTRGYVRLAAD